MSAVAELVGGVYRLALRELLPARCGACERFGEFLCAECRSSLSPAGGARCETCWQTSAGERCPRCAEYGFVCTAVRACYTYDGPAKQVILAMKYGGHHALASVVGGLMAARWPEFGLEADLVVPVPLHARRRRQRGFNQAALLAGTLGRALILPVDERSLARPRPTPPQARTSSAEERRANVYGAFACAAGALRDRRVLLVDDVTTTGATLGASAAALYAAGAAAVYGYAFAVAS